MRKATLLSIVVTTVFYMLCGCMGYAAFGDDAPGNLLTGFGFYNPYWLLDIANLAIVVHLVGAYQVSSSIFVLNASRHDHDLAGPIPFIGTLCFKEIIEVKSLHASHQIFL